MATLLAFRLLSIILLAPLPQKSIVSGSCIKTFMHQSEPVLGGIPITVGNHHEQAFMGTCDLTKWTIRLHCDEEFGGSSKGQSVNKKCGQIFGWQKTCHVHHDIMHFSIGSDGCCLFTRFPDYSFRTGHTSSWVLLCLDWCLSAQLLVSMIAETMVWMPSPHVTSILSKSYKEVSKHRPSRRVSAIIPVAWLTRPDERNHGYHKARKRIKTIRKKRTSKTSSSSIRRTSVLPCHTDVFGNGSSMLQHFWCLELHLQYNTVLLQVLSASLLHLIMSNCEHVLILGSMEIGEDIGWVVFPYHVICLALVLHESQRTTCQCHRCKFALEWDASSANVMPWQLATVSCEERREGEQERDVV